VIREHGNAAGWSEESTDAGDILRQPPVLARNFDHRPAMIRGASRARRILGRREGMERLNILPIVTVADANPVLRRAASPVRRIDRDLRKLLDDMTSTMRAAPGVGLAAPQIGLGIRLIVVEATEDRDERSARLHRLADPEIVWRSDDLEEAQEACLSIPELYGDVMRHTSIVVKAIDVSGRRVELEAVGFEARVFQHEIDHLDGVLFPDRVASPDKLYFLEEDESGELVRTPARIVEADAFQGR
jgi:peptide deformylase